MSSLAVRAASLLVGAALALGPGMTATAAAQGRGKSTPAPARALIRNSFDARTGLAEPSLASLVAASSRGDRNEMARLVERIGVARLASIFSGTERGLDRPTLLAALDAVRFLDGGVRLLAHVARLVGDNEARVAERAARAVGELLRADQLDKLAEWEIASEEVYSACSALARVISGQSATAPLRIAALEAMSEAHSFCKSGISLEGLTADFAPEVRRAALLAPQIGQTTSADVIGDLIEDPVPIVAGAAASVWCRSQYEKLRKGPGEVEKRRLFRMRMLLLADVAPAEDTSEMLPCLSLSKDPEDVSTVEIVRKRLQQMPYQR
ncbi:MAG TPA: hypothetical protein VGG33_06170 [Polyangia bacterium]